MARDPAGFAYRRCSQHSEGPRERLLENFLCRRPPRLSGQLHDCHADRRACRLVGTGDLDLLILGLAIFAGMIWVPHGWGADDPAGFVHFALRAALCYAAYLFAPEDLRGAAVAGAAALTYVYAIIAMRKPSSVR
jgi:hypothetical protein